MTLALGLNLGPELLLWALSTLLEGMGLNYCQTMGVRHLRCSKGILELSERWNTFPGYLIFV